MCGQAVCQQYGSTGWVFALHIGPTCCIPSWHRTLVAQVLSPPRAIPADSPPLSRPEELTPQESEAGTCPGQESLDKRTSRQAYRETPSRQENRSRCRNECLLRRNRSQADVEYTMKKSYPDACCLLTLTFILLPRCSRLLYIQAQATYMCPKHYY